MRKLSSLELLSFDAKNPYYIFCPPFKSHSAGIAVLHRLCHLLNLQGYPAFLVVDRKQQARFGYGLYATSPFLLTPELTDEIAKLHHKHGLTPIVVYPDTIKGHPLGNGLVCRYFLNYPGALGVEVEFDKDEIHFSYSRNIAKTTLSPENVLFVPASDPNVFYPPAVPVNREGTCFYAAKFKSVHGGLVSGIPSDSFEITRDQPDSLTKDQLRDLFQRKELFYCFENSALAIEAALCGCPVVFMPSPCFAEAIAEFELGSGAFAWRPSGEQLDHVKSNVSKFREQYAQVISGFDEKLEKFIHATQLRAGQLEYHDIISLDSVIFAVGPELICFPFVRFQKKLAWFVRHYPWRYNSKDFIMRFARLLGMEELVRWIKAKVYKVIRGSPAHVARRLPKQRPQKI